jgi:hypothetical protein
MAFVLCAHQGKLVLTCWHTLVNKKQTLATRCRICT